jgi:membrane protein YdbS with pleckstrin-like domain
MAEMTELRLDPRSITPGRIGGWIFTAIVAIWGGGGALTALVLSGAPLVSWLATGAIAAAIVLALALASHFGPLLVWRSTRLRVDDAGLEIERGVHWRHRISVARARIQHTDVTQGPLQRRFGIGTLVVYTAGTEHAAITISGLAHETALALRDTLLDGGRAGAPREGEGDAV